VNSIRFTMVYESDLGWTRRVAFLIIETSSGEVEIVQEGQPLVDADRSCAVTVKGYDIILEVERADR